jgi:2-polyprenyl-3-methyl-5-hydroxy-6-metoxy-1,4-benzoquinol methylase
MDDIEAHFGLERERLCRRNRQALEFVRTLEPLDRFLPAPPARILDVGGGPGTYAAPLARRGYEVRLPDPVGLHVEQAQATADAQPDALYAARAAEGEPALAGLSAHVLAVAYGT